MVRRKKSKFININSVKTEMIKISKHFVNKFTQARSVIPCHITRTLRIFNFIYQILFKILNKNITLQKTLSDWIVLYIKHKILRHKNKETFLHELVRLQWCRRWQMPVRHGEERAVDLSVDLHPYPHPFSQTLTLPERIRLWMQTMEMSFLQGVAVREQFPADWFFADLEYICTIIAKDSQRKNEVILFTFSFDSNSEYEYLTMCQRHVWSFKICLCLKTTYWLHWFLMVFKSS